jgi:invasion protein IalB
VAAATLVVAISPGAVLAQADGAAKAGPGKSGAAKSPRRELLQTETKKFGNWVLTCEEYSDRPGKPVCSAMLKIVDSRSGRLLFAWILAKQNKTGQIVGLLQTPTGVAIEPGVTFRFSKFERRFSYTSCEPGRCSTVVPLGLALRKEIGRVRKGHISIVSISGQRINFEILPDGFDKAYRAVLAVK